MVLLIAEIVEEVLVVGMAVEPVEVMTRTMQEEVAVELVTFV